MSTGARTRRIVAGLLGKRGPLWWISAVVLVAVAVYVGLVARPFICTLDPICLYRYEAHDSVGIPGLVVLESRSTWALGEGPDGKFLPSMLVIAAIALVVSRWPRPRHLPLLEGVGSVLLFSGVVGMTWQLVSGFYGWPDYWHEVLLLRSPFSSWPDGYSEAYSLSELYLGASALLLGLWLLSSMAIFGRADDQVPVSPSEPRPS